MLQLRQGPVRWARLSGFLFAVRMCVRPLTRFTSWRGVFVVLSIVGAILLAASIMLATETLPAENRQPGNLARTAATYRMLWRDRTFALHGLTGALAFGTLFAYISGSPFVLEDGFGLDPQLFSLAFGVNSVAIVIFSLTNRWRTVRSATALGLMLLITGSATVLLGATFDGGIWLLLVGFFVLASGFGSIAPNVVALAMSDHPEVAGSAAALMGAAQFVVAGVLAPIAGVGGGGAIALGLVLTVIAVVAALTGAFALRRVGPGSA